MTRLPRPCLDCGTTTTGSRCPTCRRRHDQQRGTTTQRMGKGWHAISQRVIRRDHGICHWCGAHADTADHLIPRSKGGTNDMTNLVAACRTCNSRRGNRG